VLQDTAAFVAALPELARRHGVLAGPVRIARAPGRLDVMGGIADYSGSLVLQLPLGCAVHAAIAPRADRRIRVVSLGADEDLRRAGAPLSTGGRERSAGFELDAVLDAADDSYAQCRRLFEAADAAWAGYVLGPLAVLGEEAGLRPATGFDLLLHSAVPEGAGVSSSAAVEVASAAAFAALFGAAEPLPARRLALCCQTAENRIVGAPCGAMDQVTAACGEAGRLLRLLCQPAEIEGQVAIPAGFALFGIDSGVRHAVAGDPYTVVRTGAFMGFRMLVEREEVGAWSDGDHAAFVHPRWGTYLANVDPSEFAAMEDLLPEQMVGSAFLIRFGGTSDTVTHVQPERSYPVRRPTAHPIHEHHRTRTFAALLPHAAEPGVAELLGELMLQSHASYSACGLGSAATDALVDAVRAAGPERGLFGAKITGGGSGGTVAILARAEARPLVETIAARHAAATGHGGRLFDDSSPGAAAAGIVEVRLP
jgi:L-arabinokinase